MSCNLRKFLLYRKQYNTNYSLAHATWLSLKFNIDLTSIEIRINNFCYRPITFFSYMCGRSGKLFGKLCALSSLCYEMVRVFCFKTTCTDHPAVLLVHCGQMLSVQGLSCPKPHSLPSLIPV